MRHLFIFSLIASSAFFHWENSINAHPIDIHIPTSHDYLFEMEYERMRANQDAEKILEDPDSSREDLDKALDQLYGPNGTHA